MRMEAGGLQEAAEGMAQPAADSEPEVFEAVLPITVFVLSDEDFLQDDKEQEVPIPEVEQEFKLNNSLCIKNEVEPSNDSSSVGNWDANKTVSNEDNCITYSEDKWLAESVCNTSKLSLSDGCGADMDKYGQNCMLPTLSCKTELPEIIKYSDGEDCGDNDGFQKIPPLLSSADSDRADTSETLVVVPKHEEEPVSIAGVLFDGSPQNQPEIHKELEIIVKMEDPDSSKNGDNEIDYMKISKFEDETLNSLLEHGLKEEEKFTYNCSDPFLNVCSSTFEEHLEDVGKPDMNASTSAESNTTGEHIYKTLPPFPKRKYQQQKVVSSHASPEEFQSKQEGLKWLNDSVTITPLPKTSCFTKENERSSFKCRFCSSVYKCSAHLKKHIYSAHKDKKIHKCCFCKKTFFFSFNLKNHLKFHKKIARLQKARKNRISARKGREKGSEDGESETKKKESKYHKFFIKIDRDFTSLDVPVRFSCRICFFASSNPRSFIHHMKGHKERPPYQCPQCDYSCSSLSYLLNHMYWHAGYKLYQCRFCTFFSLYFASMVRHSHVHTRDKPYSCELCQAAFTSTSGLERHRRIHTGTETCQGQQPDCLSGRKRTEKPPKNYTCEECNLVFYTKGHLSFHKRFHEQLKANGSMSQSNKYCKSKIHKTDGDSQGHVSHSLFDRENDCLGKGIMASEVEYEQADGVWDNEKIRPGKKFLENSQGSNSLGVTGNRSEVPQTSYQMDAVTYKEEPFFKSGASLSRVQEDASFHNFVEDLEDTCFSNLNTFQTYRCQHCSYVTDVPNNFRLHLKIHTDERPFVCKECNEAFKTSNHLQKHSLLHVKNGQEFGSFHFVERCLENLELHREINGGTYPERDDLGFCKGINSSLLGSEVCGVQQGVQRGPVNDVQTQSQPLLYQCTECSYATGFLNNLELHIRTHTGEKPYSCSVCEKKFRTSSHLKRHSLTHLTMGHFKCTGCDYSTSKWLSLKQHLASHTGEGTSSPGCLYEHKELPVKTYRCEECGYCTAHKGNLKLHMRIHTGEKPFQCGQCSLAFRTSSHLKRHLLTHLKLRCRRCKYSTTDKHAFQKHIKMHKKKYKCAKCNVVLPTRKILEKHKQQHKPGV
ncbi:PREDICTED: zinc finger protein 845-like [Pseudopodoces humilis]|uniref:zinc finger protein 845-like n=1 Tax=Pseudopodoces humilis TaxID=181119 RepID=UPI0006B6ED4C|nr:PREDICTED: zinc finger protein 845-like [Pseudopodoces humilis]